MNEFEGETENDYGIELSEQAAEYLRITAKWAHFLAIVGFVMIGIMVLMGLFIGTVFSAFIPEEDSLGLVSQGGLTIMYLIIALLYFFPTLYLFRFAKRTRTALETENSELLTGGLEQLKSCFKFLGILMIVVLCFYAIGIVIAVFTASIMGGS